MEGQPTRLAVRLYVLQKMATAALPRATSFQRSWKGRRATSSRRRWRSLARGPGERVIPRPTQDLVAAVQTCSAAAATGSVPFRPGSPGRHYVLSNNHVLADVNSAPIGSDILQPGPADRGTFFDRVAELHRFALITLGGTVAKRLGAAIGLLTGEGQ